MGPGKFFAKKLTTTAGGDLCTQLKTALGVDTLMIYKMTLVFEGDTKIKVNNGVYSELYADADGKYYLSLNFGDVVINSVVTETADRVVYAAIVYA